MEITMIKPRRVGHATFETRDIEKQIAYWTEVAGLVLAEREKKRAFLASKTGLRWSRPTATTARGSRSRSRPTAISTRWRRNWPMTASRRNFATTPSQAWARC
jgi:hypothetical protein